MKIKLSKSQWQFVGKKAGWIKSAIGMYDLLDLIKMEGDHGLSLLSMYFFELEDAKKLEASGIIKKVKKQSKEGPYLAYVINEEHQPDFEESKAYMENLRKGSK